MVACSCPHCKSYASVRRGAKKPQQCKMCGGFFNLSSVVSGVKKLASNPMVQQLARAAAPHAMKALQKHAPGLGAMANRAVSAVQRVAANPMVQRIASNPMVQNLARAAAPRALQALESRAPGLVSAARSAASSQLGQQGISALRSKVGFGRKGRRAYGSESDEEGGAKLQTSHAHKEKISQALARKLAKIRNPESDVVAAYLAAPPSAPLGRHSAQRAKERAEEDAMLHAMSISQSSPAAAKYISGQGRRRKAHSRYGRGGLGLSEGMQLGRMALGAIPGASDALGPFGALLGGPDSAPPPPPPRASFQGMQGFQAPGMMARPSVMGRGRRTRPPTAHSLAVKEVMAQTGMGLPHASRYVKEHGLARRG